MEKQKHVQTGTKIETVKHMKLKYQLDGFNSSKKDTVLEIQKKMFHQEERCGFPCFYSAELIP